MISRIMRGIKPVFRGTAAAQTTARSFPQRLVTHTFTADIQVNVQAVGRLLSKFLPIPTPVRAPIPRNHVPHFSTAIRNLSYAPRPLIGLRTLHVPRGPIVPRTVTEVGLGAVRNFSSSRPLFQNVIQNAPIAVRALAEADWDVKRRQANLQRARSFMKPAASSIKSERSKAVRYLPIVQKTKTHQKSQPQPVDEPEYFQEAPKLAVTTILTVPLAPSDIRTPLPIAPSPTRLLDSTMLETHNLYASQEVRVRSLERRLDSANVWARGASVDFYGIASAGENQAPAAFWVIQFEGWTAQMVKDVIGEAGVGWCILEEVHASSPASPEPQEPLSQTLLGFNEALAVEATSSLIMPTIDLSQSSLSSIPPGHQFSESLQYDDSAISTDMTPPSEWHPSYPGSPGSELSEEFSSVSHPDFDDARSTSSDEEGWSVPSVLTVDDVREFEHPFNSRLSFSSRFSSSDNF